MPTLLQINVVVNSGSTGRIAEEIGKAVLSAGWNSYIAYARNERPSNSNLIKIGNLCDIRWHGVQTRLFDRHGLSSTRATKKLIAQIKEVKPDIIHLHNIHGYYLNYKILFDYLSKADIPIVWTLHDCWTFTGHCSHFSFIKCNRWQTQCYKCPQKKEYPRSLFIDRSKQNFLDKKVAFTSIKDMTLVPVSNWLENLVKKSFLSNYPIQRIYNGVNTTVFSSQNNVDVINAIKQKYDIADKFTILGVANTWSPRKGFNDFIMLSKLLKEDEVIILVGLNNKQINILPKNIIGISRTENIEELASLYSVSDAFANPTYEDNFPTTNIESLSCGTPIITYKTGGSVEAVSQESGLIVNQGDINGLYSAIQKIKKQGKEYYSAACRKRVLDNFRKEDRYAEYLDLYNCLLNKK